MNERPKLNKHITFRDFTEFYWLKKELISFCRKIGLKTSGGKVEISERIIHFLQTGIKKFPAEKTTRKATSKFNWHSEKLMLKTKLTDSYKNTANVRRFLQNEIGNHFKFNIKFMKWMKENPGRTLADAIYQWRKIESETKANTKPKVIAPQFEYNTYLRDFSANNPNQDRKTAIKLWNIKKSRRGDNIYRKSDLKMLEKKESSN